MCQLNVYCIPKGLDKKIVFEYMKGAFGISEPECIDDEEVIAGLKNEYSFYISGGIRCNCGSALCSQQDNAELEDWELLKKQLSSDKLKRLNAVKELMEAKDYKRARKDFTKRQEEFWKRLDAFTAHVGKKEAELSNAIFKRKDISEEEKEILVQKEVYPVINDMMDKAENSAEYKSLLAEYQEFLKENELLSESCGYNLKRTSPKSMEMVDLTELLKNNPDAEIIDVDMPSDCIYDAIALAEKEDYSSTEKEIEEIKSFVSNILSRVPQMKIFCFWQDGEKPQVLKEKRVSLSNFTAESVVFLKYNELLTITK